MSEHATQKAKRLSEILDEITTLTAEIEGDEAKNTDANREKITALLTEGETLRKSIEQDKAITGLKSFAKDPANPPKSQPYAVGDGVISQPFSGISSLGDQFIASEQYKAMLGADNAVKKNVRAGFEAKGFMFPSGSKATFDTASGGLDSTVNYLSNPIILVSQQRLTIRDLLSVGQTTMNAVPYLKETSYTGAADTVAEEGEKPEATLLTEDASAPVKKIAVVLKVTDEMFADFPVLRDYIDSRLRFMVLQKEEQQLLSGTGSGSQITGILNSSPQTVSATSPGELDAILEAKTKVARADLGGGYEADGIVINPADWMGLRKLKDAVNGQYYGGGPFYGPYGQGGFIEEPTVWGLRPVVTSAIAAGTALVGAFKLGAMIFQREGVAVEAFNQNEDDVIYNRVTLRVEERLALAVWRPKAFCTVTDISF